MWSTITSLYSKNDPKLKSLSYLQFLQVFFDRFLLELLAFRIRHCRLSLYFVRFLRIWRCIPFNPFFSSFFGQITTNFHVRISHLSAGDQLSLAKRTRARNSRHIVLFARIWCHHPSLLSLVRIYCNILGGKIVAPKFSSRFSLIHADLHCARVRHNGVLKFYGFV